MKFILSYVFYYIGDIISLTTMRWGNGYGYTIYSFFMNLSIKLDTKAKIWKHVKQSKRSKKK